MENHKSKLDALLFVEEIEMEEGMREFDMQMVLDETTFVSLAHTLYSNWLDVKFSFNPFTESLANLTLICPTEYLRFQLVLNSSLLLTFS